MNIYRPEIEISIKEILEESESTKKDGNLITSFKKLADELKQWSSTE